MSISNGNIYAPDLQVRQRETFKRLAALRREGDAVVEGCVSGDEDAQEAMFGVEEAMREENRMLKWIKGMSGEPPSKDGLVTRNPTKGIDMTTATNQELDIEAQGSHTTQRVGRLESRRGELAPEALEGSPAATKELSEIDAELKRYRDVASLAQLAQAETQRRATEAEAAAVAKRQDEARAEVVSLDGDLHAQEKVLDERFASLAAAIAEFAGTLDRRETARAATGQSRGWSSPQYRLEQALEYALRERGVEKLIQTVSTSYPGAPLAG